MEKSSFFKVYHKMTYIKQVKSDGKCQCLVQPNPELLENHCQLFRNSISYKCSHIFVFGVHGGQEAFDKGRFGTFMCAVCAKHLLVSPYLDPWTQWG